MDAEPATTDRPITPPPPAPPAPAPPAPAPSVVVQAAEPAGRGFSVGSFVLGVVTTLVAGAIGLVVFLAVSDADDDGNIDLEVPAVDVDIDG